VGKNSEIWVANDGRGGMWIHRAFFQEKIREKIRHPSKKKRGCLYSEATINLQYLAMHTG
jgi:hypothetical protein